MKAVLVIGIIAFILLVGSCSSYRQLVTMDEAAAAQWSQVDVQLQRRYDLIPNLVSTVKGYAAHEKAVFDDIATSRQAYANAGTTNDKAKAANQVEGALGHLLAISEAYPDLKANQNFLTLQDQLEGTENRIGVERERYNETVRMLNTYLRSPTGMVGNLFAHVKPRDYFTPPSEQRAVPKVDFSNAPTVPVPAQPAHP